MFTELRFSGATSNQLRAIATTLHQQRHKIPASIRNGHRSPTWAPVVHCDGPSLFTIFTPGIPGEVAADILAALGATAHTEQAAAVAGD